ncbi:23S rRNA (pseudouridine(1915)-N(3))-methyltransferase RlmH [Thiovibrio sp. JS02]
MKCVIPFLGKTREAYLAAGIDDFRERLRRYAQIETPIVREKKRTAREEPERLKQEEAQALARHVAAAAKVVALDLSGKQLGSEEFAEFITRWEEQGVREVAFLIGGPLGLAAEVVSRADLVLSLSRMTFTHEMARLLLLEQLYRAFTIKAGTGYHK